MPTPSFRCPKTKIFSKIVKTSFDGQVLADDDTKCQLNQEVEDLREAIKVLH